jgi:CheY-like chemotaxis protein
MPLPIIICDDSSFARKQIARALPKGWDVDVTFAASGREALEAIRAGRGDLLLLDLTMPDMDGFAVLEYIRRHDLPTLVIVVSGDVQEGSRRRALELGALTFIKKPVDTATLGAVLDDYGLLGLLTGGAGETGGAGAPGDFLDWCQELANVAMGRAADLLAQVIEAPVELSIPRVSRASPAALIDLLVERTAAERVPAVIQGFIGGGIAGESLALFRGVDTERLARLLHYRQEELTRRADEELLTDVATLLFGATLKGLADQLDIGFSQGQPGLQRQGGDHWRRLGVNLPAHSQVLTIELNYAFGREDIHCDLLLLFTPEAAAMLAWRADFVMEVP